MKNKYLDEDTKDPGPRLVHIEQLMQILVIRVENSHTRIHFIRIVCFGFKMNIF